MRHKSCFALLLLATLTTGCRVGPNHYVPPVEVPEEWSSPELIEAPVEISPDHSLACWWNNFNDPLLSEYIERIFQDNLDVQIAYERISQAYFHRGAVASKLYPQIDGDVNKTRSKPGQFGFFTAPTAIATALKIQQETIITQLIGSWEIDLFGRIRRQIESASANIGVQIEIKNGILISTLSEFARNYIEFRGNQQLVANIEEQISLLKERLNLTQQRYNYGVDNEQTLQTIEENLNTLQSSLPPIQSSLYASLYRLSVLIGQNPEYLLDGFTDASADLYIPNSIPEVLPSELLLRRPDIRQAERNLAANTADLGVAYAEMFPKVNLSGIVGYERIKLPSILLKSNLWSYGVDALQPIFRGGEIKDNILLHESLRKEAMINYQRTILLAFEETENAIINFMNASLVLNDNTIAYDIQRKLYDHAENQFQAGTFNRIELILARQSLLIAQQNVINAKIQLGVYLVALYKALGGGW